MFSTKRGWSWAYRTRDFGYRLVLRAFFPAVAKAVKKEHRDRAFPPSGTSKAPEHKLIVDKGSDTTIVSFSSAAMLHAGQPTSEFGSFFKRHGAGYNLIFFRDVHRSAYHLAPDGGSGGVDFYETELKAELKNLGSTRHIAIGDSAGAAAAIYYGTRCGFDQIIAFSPPFPLRHWIGPLAQLRTLFDVPLMWREPQAYVEHVVLSLTSTYWLFLPIGLRCGFRNFWNPIRTYKEAETRPRLTVFFGEGSRPDRTILRPIVGLPEATLKPLPTAAHFCMVALARTGRLGPAIMGIIEAR